MQVRAETPPTCSFTRRLLAALTVPSFRPPNPSPIRSPSFKITASVQPAAFPPEEKTTFFLQIRKRTLNGIFVILNKFRSQYFHYTVSSD
jgi:hypothetical protein